MWRTLLLSLCAALTQLSNGAVDMLELEEYNNLVIDNEVDTHDLVLMFYAPWCPHCQNFAGIYERISEILLTDSVTTESEGKVKMDRVRMAYFNCEASEGAMEVCRKYDVKHYPSLAYHGVNVKPPNDWVKFNGNVGVGEEVRDWIKIMAGISGYERAERGVWDFLRGGRKKNKKRRGAVRGVAEGGGGGGGGGATAQEITQVQAVNDALQDSLAQYEAIFNTLLLTPEYKDPFEFLNTLNWSNEITKTCVVDVTVDYCQRYVESVRNPIRSDDEVVEIVSTNEPYCVVVDGCIEAGFPDNYSCRPKACPLGDMGCKYAAVCLEDEVRGVYEEVLKAEGVGAEGGRGGVGASVGT